MNALNKYYYSIYNGRSVEIHWLNKYNQFQVVYADTLKCIYVNFKSGFKIIHNFYPKLNIEDFNNI